MIIVGRTFGSIPAMQILKDGNVPVRFKTKSEAIRYLRDFGIPDWDFPEIHFIDERTHREVADD